MLCSCGLTRVRAVEPKNAFKGNLRHAGHQEISLRSSTACFSQQDPDSVSLPPQPDTQQDLKTYEKKRWSNLNAGMVHVPGTVIGSATLIAGTTIGEVPKAPVSCLQRAHTQ